MTSVTTTTTATDARDDLLTHIHKAIRFGLFDITVRTGRTDWTDQAQVADLDGRWRPILALLRAHTAHEEQYIFRLLDTCDPGATRTISDQHADLDDLLDDLAERFDAMAAAPLPAAGITLYRDLARFVAGYLPHLHEEETRIMARIWECCTDEEIAATRQRFMADASAAVQAVTVEYLLPAVDGPSRRQLIAAVSATSPRPVLDHILSIARRALSPADYDDLVVIASAAAI